MSVEQLTLLIFIFASILYALLFLSELHVGLKPLFDYVSKKLNATSYNQQQKISLISRAALGLLMPLMGYLVDIGINIKDAFEFVILLTVISVIVLIISGLRLRVSFGTKVIWDRDMSYFYYSLIYGFQYFAILLVMLISLSYSEYRATILQTATLLNFATVVVYVWIIDKNISRDIDCGIDSPESVINSILLGRITGKMFVLLALLIYYSSVL